MSVHRCLSVHPSIADILSKHSSRKQGCMLYQRLWCKRFRWTCSAWGYLCPRSTSPSACARELEQMFDFRQQTRSVSRTVQRRHVFCEGWMGIKSYALYLTVTLSDPNRQKSKSARWHALIHVTDVGSEQASVPYLRRKERCSRGLKRGRAWVWLLLNTVPQKRIPPNHQR